MRALRVVGVTGDGSVVLEDPGRRERYTVPADEQLRAAARGDVTRLGQIAIELESQLRPREIQARIRGGASVDEVAAAAGVPTQKIERFAYPVLLERSRTAELAQGAHPQRADGPDTRTLGETVAHTFGLRGQDYTTAGWDSWKGDDGKWVVVLTWQTGRSDNAAHWAFQPGAHGGTVVPLDEHASDLVEGLPARPLRPLGAVVDMARDDEPTPAPAPSEPAAARAVAGGPAESAWSRGIAPEQRRSSTPPRTRVETPGRTGRVDETRPPAADAPVIPRVPSENDGPVRSGATAFGHAARDNGAVDRVDATGSVRGDSAVTGSVLTDAASTDLSEDRVASTGAAVEGPASSPAGDSVGATSADGSADTAPAERTGSDRETGSVTTTASTGSAAPEAPSADTAGTATTNGVAHSDSDTASTSVSADASESATGSATTDSSALGSATTESTPAAESAEASTPATPAAEASDPASATTGSTVAEDAGTPSSATAEAPRSAGDATAAEAEAATTTAASTTSSTGSDTSTEDDASTGTRTEKTGTDTPAESSTAEPEAASTEETAKPDAEETAPRQRTGGGSRRTKKGKPVMPSWDEVLLGVRGQR